MSISNSNNKCTPSSRLPRATTTPTTTGSTTPTRASTPTSKSSTSTSRTSTNKHAHPSSSSSSKTSRTKSTLNSSNVAPKILPFPDLSTIRYSRESSRAGSPLSTPPIDRLGVTFDQMIMMRTTSSEGAAASGSRTVQSRGTSPTPTSPHASASASASTSALASSTSPPVSSPLASPRPNQAQPQIHATSTTAAATPAAGARGRSSTAPSVAVATPPALARPLSTTITSASASASPLPSRTEGFLPSSPTRTPLTRSTTTMSTPLRTAPSAPTNQTTSVRSQASPVTRSPRSLTTPVFPPPPHDFLTDHIRQSFLKGTCADVRLVVRKWGVCYHVHRMVLSQASFFHSLFLGGFSETTPAPKRTAARKGKERAKTDVITEEEWHGEDVELRFDDPNITRAAFEISLSRLYSPLPHLHVPTILLPTAARPLTPSFPSASTPDLQALQSSSGQEAHLATPRLLLSLLATTIYLGHGNLMKEALVLIMRTVGPMTVNRYLAFAVGDGIGDEEWEGQSDQGAKGLESVAKRIRGNQPDLTPSRPDEDEEMVEDVLRAAQHTPRWSTDSETKVRDDDSKVGDTSDIFGSAPSQIPTLRFPSRSSSMRSADIDPFSFASADARLLPHFYGVVGNKIGEACACWLARWGITLLQAEVDSPPSDTATRIWSHRGLPARFIRALLSSDFLFVKDEMERYRAVRRVLDLRRQGWEEDMEDSGDLSLSLGAEGTEPDWEEWEEEEAELQRVIAEGIHYCHMTFEDLSTIAADIDPSTSLPYAPLAVLQAAHWTAADLRARVTAHERTTSPALSVSVSTSAEDENELGLTHSTSSIATSITKRRRPTPRSRVPSPAAHLQAFGLSPHSRGSTLDVSQSATSTLSASSAQSIWYPVPVDELHRVGASGLVPSVHTGAGFQGIPDLVPELSLGDNTPDSASLAAGAAGATGQRKTKPPPHGERSFFGLQGGKLTIGEIEDKWVSEGGAFAMGRLGLEETVGGGKREDMWTKVEPFRFAVEFWDVDKLGEKERFYSTTHFYAGSFFNCYVQMIKRKEKGVQLGIYLYRQSPNEPFPTPSAPRDTTSEPTATPVSAVTVSTPIPHQRSSSVWTNNLSAIAGPGSPPVISSSLGNSTVGGASNEAPYQDTRAVTKAYFSISCASALGTALIRFTSGPDSFAHSQSWGWKSSALKSEEFLALPPLSAVPTAAMLNADEGEEESLDQGVLGWQGSIPPEWEVGQSSLRATVVVGVV